MINLITTADGSHTLYVPEINEHYHSTYGAVQESMIVFIRNGYDSCRADTINVLEIGFGTGLNALLTLSRALEDRRRINYVTLEKYPLGKDVTDKLNYHKFAGIEGSRLFRIIHSAGWDTTSKIADNFFITKLKADFISYELSGNFNLIYFDAFAPDKQPEMWEAHLFRKIESVTVPGGIFVTYSSKGAVKRLLKLCGFKVSLVPGPPGKRETIRAVKI